MKNSNKVALVTGGTRGIGLGIALRLAEDGFTLAISGRRKSEEVQSALKQVRAHSPESIYVQADNSQQQSRHELVSTLEEHFGRLDVLVNNAGIAPSIRADLLDATEASFDELINTNLKGPYFLTQSIAAWMIRQQEADPLAQRSIINIGSISATVASVNRGDYCISKAGIAMATKLWAVRLAQHGISVYEIRPGIMQTDMTKGVQEKYDSLIQGDLLLQKRWGTAEDVGKAVSLLARGELPYATGAVLIQDGGLTLERL
jgi:NAD(P)-dependent dehydrogenase (short-subunit alcohol dehydrogenase family)